MGTPRSKFQEYSPSTVGKLISARSNGSTASNRLGLLNEHRCPHCLRTSGQNAVLSLAAALQLCVQLQISRFRERHLVVAVEVFAFSFHTALFVYGPGLQTSL